MNVAKSLLKRVGIITGSVILLPLAAVILVGLVGLILPFCVGAGIIAALTMSDESINDCFKVETVDPDIVID